MECFSLEEQEQSLKFAIRHGALVIYWHHGLGQFRHMTGADKDTIWKDEMKLLRSYCSDGRISSITAGEPINVDGTDLYPMEIVMGDLQCYAYPLLCRRGNLGEAEKTPYFFVGKQTRDQTIKYLKGKMRMVM